MKYDRQNDFRRKKEINSAAAALEMQKDQVLREFFRFFRRAQRRNNFRYFFSRDLISRHIQFQFLARNFAQ